MLTVPLDSRHLVSIDPIAGRTTLVVPGSPASSSFDELIAAAARDAAAQRDDEYDGPLDLDVEYRYAMPSSERRRVGRMSAVSWRAQRPSCASLGLRCVSLLRENGLIGASADVVTQRVVKQNVDETLVWVGVRVRLCEASMP